jgi:hypothetical protein
MKRPLFIKLITAFLFFSFLSCKKENSENKKTLNKLYEMFKDGSISICQYNGQTVYTAAINAYDTGGGIFDKNGNLIGNCNYAWGSKPDPICGQVTNCKIIYMVKDNIWGQPAVNLFKLGQ